MEFLAGLLGGMDMDDVTSEEMAWVQKSALLAMSLTFHVAPDVRMRVITSMAVSDDLIYIILIAQLQGFSLEQIGACLTQLFRVFPDDDNLAVFCEYVINGGRQIESLGTNDPHVDDPVTE